MPICQSGSSAFATFVFIACIVFAVANYNITWITNAYLKITSFHWRAYPPGPRLVDETYTNIPRASVLILPGSPVAIRAFALVAVTYAIAIGIVFSRSKANLYAMFRSGAVDRDVRSRGCGGVGDVQTKGAVVYWPPGPVSF